MEGKASEADSLLEERVAQLHLISQRRNALLRQMFHMVQRRQSVGTVIKLEDEGEEEVVAFLDRFDLVKNPETGSIHHLAQNELFAEPSPSPSESPPAPSPSPPSSRPILPTGPDITGDVFHELQQARETSSPRPPVSAKFPSIPVSRASSIPVQHSPPESDDELDLIGTPTVSIKSAPPQSRAPSEAVRNLDTTPVSETIIVVDGDDSVEGEQIIIVDGDTTDEDDLTHIVHPPSDTAVSEVPALDDTALPEESPETHPPVNEVTQAPVHHVEDAAEEATKVDVASPEVPAPSAESNDMAVDEDLFSVHDELSPPPSEPAPSEPAPVAISPTSVNITQAASPQPLPPDPFENVDMDVIPVQVQEAEDGLETAYDEPIPIGRTATSVFDPQPIVIDDDDEGQAELQVAREESIRRTSSAKYLTKESTPQPIVVATPPSPVLIREPSSTISYAAFDFTGMSDPPSQASRETSVTVSPSRPGYHPTYTLPPLKVMPADLSRKTKPAKQQRKHKDRDKNGVGDKTKDKDDWAPLGISRWGATLRANPVHVKVSRAPKCLNSREWSVAMNELRLMRALEQVESLKDAGRWSFRQPKKQRGIGGLTKTHWDYLMDEMKWMRIDFREERKWKLALAYNLSTAVLEWHCFSTLAERVAKGICVGWRRPRADIIQPELIMADDGLEQRMDVDMGNSSTLAPVGPSPLPSLLGVDYGSDDDDDDEQDKQSVVDALEPSSVLDDALDAAEKAPNDTAVDSGFTGIEFDRGNDSEEPASASEDIFNKMDVDEEEEKSLVEKQDGQQDKVSLVGLKEFSNDPVLLQGDSIAGDPSGDINGSTSATKPSMKANIYKPLREHLAYSGPDKLFVDLHDLDQVVMNASADDLSADPAFPPADLSEIFPDLPPLGMLDVAPPPTSVPEGKVKKSEKRDRDDPNKRMEETMYTKLFLVGQFMYTKPTLIGPLQPAKRWKNGSWLNADDCPAADRETPFVKMDDCASELFNLKFANAGMLKTLDPLKEKDAKEKETPKRTTHIWTAVDDNLLKTLADKYPNNWPLIAECYNSARPTIPTDKRLPRDCQERWKERWAPEHSRPKAQEAATPVEDIVALPMTPTPPTPTPSMTTRGIKRLASVSVSGPPPAASGSDAKKRRRHQYIQDTIRKAVRRRTDQAQKFIANQRKAPAVHETHAQYSRLPKLSPAELSRMKAEKEAKDNQDLAANRRRHEEMTRAAQQQRMPPGAQPQTPVAQPQVAQALQTQIQAAQQAQGSQVAQNQQQVASTQQTSAQGQPPTPAQLQQLQHARLTATARNQVNISQQQQHQQQQRIASPMGGQRPMTSQQQQQHLLAQQARIQHQHAQAQQALAHQQALALQAHTGAGPNGSAPVGVRPGTSSPRPPTAATVPANALPRQPMYNIGLLQNYTPEQLQHVLQQAQIAQQNQLAQAQLAQQLHQQQSQGQQNQQGHGG